LQSIKGQPKTNYQSEKSQRLISSSEPDIICNAVRPGRNNRPFLKSNSTSSLFLKKMIPHYADTSVMVKCMSRAVFYEILRNNTCSCRDIFCERLQPLDPYYYDLDVNPSLKQIEGLLKKIFDKQSLAAECAVMAIAYIDKIKRQNIHLCSHNWRRVLLGALLISEKVWEDQIVWNVDYTKSFPELEVEDLLKLERQFLIKIQFELTLKPSEYARYYFGLVSLRESTEDNYPLKPLDKSTATHLEANAKGIQEAAKKSFIHRRPYKSQNYYSFSSNISIEQLRQIRSDSI